MSIRLISLAAVALSVSPSFADDVFTARRELPTKAFTPDPSSVERYGPAYRYPQAGWIVLHIEGEPYERGVPARPAAGPGDRRYLRTLRRAVRPQGARRRRGSNSARSPTPCSSAVTTRNTSKR